MKKKPSRLTLSFERQEISKVIENRLAQWEIEAASREIAATTEVFSTKSPDLVPNEDEVMDHLLARIDTNVKYDPTESPVYKSYKNKIREARQHSYNKIDF